MDRQDLCMGLSSNRANVYLACYYHRFSLKKADVAAAKITSIKTAITAIK